MELESMNGISNRTPQGHRCQAILSTREHDIHWIGGGLNWIASKCMGTLTPDVIISAKQSGLPGHGA
eukprot:9243804-Prorocentrum_lima.AAC.1